jgi:hypothetical protein
MAWRIGWTTREMPEIEEAGCRRCECKKSPCWPEAQAADARSGHFSWRCPLVLCLLRIRPLYPLSQEITAYLNICPENGGIGVGYKRDLDSQGFLDSERGFVSRWQAKRIARKHGQILEGRGKFDELYSEDLW